jgi:uncharacterized protein YggE
MSSVIVSGTAVRSVQPDRATVSLGISQVTADAATAINEIATRSQLLEALVGELGFDRTAWITDGVQVAEEWQWQNDSNVLVGYRATSGITVTVRQLPLVGPLLQRAVTSCGATIRSLLWHVDDDNPVRIELMGDAARDARARAGAYAVALGMQVGNVELISESPIDAGRPPVEAMMARSMKAESDAMSVNEGVVEVRAEVHVRFGLTAG